MTSALRPVPRPRLYEKVAAQLREYVRDAGLHVGDRLPPERELAGRLGVSRSSVKQAIVVFEVQGLVEVRHGGGTYLLTDTLDSEPVADLIDRRRRLPDVLDAREALETKLAELAAARRTDADVLEMTGALEAMRTAVQAGELGEEGDRRFHAAVTTAAHSPILAGFYRELAGQISESRAESLRQPHRPARSLRQHERVAQAILAQQPGRAASAMRRHVQTVSQVRLLSWTPDDDGE